MKDMNKKKLIYLSLLSAFALLLYITVGLNLRNSRVLLYALSLRIPKLLAMVITAIAIGGASMVFQTVINNRIVTPCILGMNSLYTLVHTSIYFFLGSASFLVTNSNIAFLVDVIVMSAASLVIYGYLFKKTDHNVLYVLLIGTILTSFFSSVQSTLVRVMDSNEYDTLLNTLVASFTNINSELLFISILLLLAVAFFLRKELKLLDVISLGKESAINLGVDYDRTVRRLLMGVTILIAIATALVGPISFLGLIIANLSRQLLKTYRHTQLILGSVLMGIIVLVFGQLITEQVFTYTVPVSTFITIGGGIYFLYLLIRVRNK